MDAEKIPAMVLDLPYVYLKTTAGGKWNAWALRCAPSGKHYHFQYLTSRTGKVTRLQRVVHELWGAPEC